jgi:organic radical activating enzyme
MIIEWELISTCNYNCNYCSLPNIKAEHNLIKINTFIEETLLPYRNEELFCFGGEPFLNNNIDYIISKLIKEKQNFIIQTNASKKSIDVMKLLNNKIDIQISIHPSQINLEDIEEYILQLLKMKHINIKKIDIMYSHKDAIKYYLKLVKIVKDILFLIPISGFYEDESCLLTKEYNIIRRSFYSKIIKFEDNMIGDKYRSDVWEEYCNGKTTYNKPCMYTNNYMLFDSMLQLYNCCYRKITNGICKEQKCFLM